MTQTQIKSQRLRRKLFNTAVTLALILSSIIMCELLYRADIGEQNIIIFMVLASFIVTAITDGYIYGFVAAVSIVFLYDFLITTPRLGFSFSLGFPITLIIMLLATLVTGAVTARIKQKVTIAEGKEQRAELLYEINRRLMAGLDEKTIAQYALEFLKKDLHRSVALFTCAEDAQAITCYFNQAEGDAEPDFFMADQEQDAVRAVAQTKQAVCSAPHQARSGAYGFYSPIVVQEKAYGVFGVSCMQGPLLEAHKDFLGLLTEQTSHALLIYSLAAKQRETELMAETEKLRSSFLRGISHDLRTPLTSMIGASETLLENRDDLSISTQTQLIEDIRSNSQWLLNMVENILAVTRIYQNNMSFEKTEEVIEEVIGQSIALFRTYHPNVKFHIEQSEKLLIAKLDTVLIIQVLNNLFENAFRHSRSEHLEISIHMREAAGFVELSVRDNGLGISPAILAHVFEMKPTQKGHSEDASRGMGFGLSFCKTIVEAHGGWITVGNSPKGGACFTFGLPIGEECNEK